MTLNEKIKNTTKEIITKEDKLLDKSDMENYMDQCKQLVQEYECMAMDSASNTSDKIEIDDIIYLTHTYNNVAKHYQSIAQDIMYEHLDGLA